MIWKIFEHAFYKSLDLYHISPALLTGELKWDEVKKILKSVEAKMSPIPAWWNIEMLASILPTYLHLAG